MKRHQFKEGENVAILAVPFVLITELYGMHYFKYPEMIILRTLGWQSCSFQTLGFPGGSVVKNPPANAGDVGLIPESGRSPGEGNGNPLQYSCLEKPMDRGDWQAIAHGVTKSQTPHSDQTTVTKLGMFSC